MMRAKMTLTRVHTHRVDGKSDGAVYQEDLEFRAVPRSDGYGNDGSDENNTYAKFTPNAFLGMSVSNPALFGKFKVGEMYYLNFSRAE